MTRHIDDLNALWSEEERDVCSADELLARVGHHPPIIRRRRTILAVAAAVIVVAAVVTTVVALRPDDKQTHAALPTVATASTATSSAIRSPTAAPRTPVPSASRTSVPSATPPGTPSGTASVPPGSGLIGLGDAHVRIPNRWFIAPYLGGLSGLYYPIVFFGTTPFTGICGTNAPENYECTTINYFPTDHLTPRDGLVVKWAHVLRQGPADRLNSAPGSSTVVGGHPAKIYAGAPIGEDCPSGAGTEVVMSVHTSARPDRGGDLYEMTACLGARASTADRRAVFTMVSSMRFGQ